MGDFHEVTEAVALVGVPEALEDVRVKSTCSQPLGSELKAVGKASSQHLMDRECVACLCPWSSHCLAAPRQAALKSLCSQTPVTAQGSFSAAIHRLQCAHVKHLLYVSAGRHTGTQQIEEAG